MLQFIHSADIHLDSPLVGLSSYEGLPLADIRHATRAALDNLVDLAIERAVDFVLIAGDLYDGDWRDASTGMFFVSRMSRLREHKIPVLLVRGNHDAESQITKSLHLPENVHLFGSRKAATYRLEHIGVAVHGQSYGGHHVESNLAAGFPAADKGCFNIGLLHTSLGGYAEHEPYAPCSLDDLCSKEYDYWALGHIHSAVTPSTDPLVVFPGNIQGRSIRETGQKGCYVVTVDNAGLVTSEFVPLDVLRWQSLSIDMSGVCNTEDFDARVEKALRSIPDFKQRMQLVRVVVTGATTMHAHLIDRSDWKDDLRARATDLSRENVWIEKIVVETSAPHDTAPPPVPLPVIDFAPELFQPLLQKLPDEIRQEVRDWLNPAHPRYRQLRDEASALLSARIGASEVSNAN